MIPASRSVSFSWVHKPTAAAATMVAMTALRTKLDSPGLYDTEQKALSVVQQAVQAGRAWANNTYTQALLHNERELLTLLDNVGGSIVTDIAAYWIRHRIPDKARGIPEHVHTSVFVPWRIIDAAGVENGDPRLIPTDVVAAFDAIWMAEEYAAAYAYVASLITAAGASSVQRPGTHTQP
jgi:hypothetical protein